MKMSHRGLAIFTAVILSFSFLAGCSNDKNKKTDASGSPQINTSKDALGGKINSDSSMTVEEKANAILKEMTLEEKIGQMIQPDRRISSRDVSKYFIGSVFSGGGNAPGKNRQKDWIEMCREYQEAAMSTRMGIPIIYGVDAVHGHNTVYNAVVFPHNIGLGAAGNPELMAEIGSITASEMIATGVNWNFAPCVAVARDPRWGRTYESYSENPELVKKLSVPYIKALQEKYITACAKHYAADGGTDWGTGYRNGLIDQGDTQMSEEELRKTHISVYEEAVKAGVKTVMISFSSWKGIKHHQNKELIQGVLKGELGFAGFVISDYEAIHQLSGKDFYEQLVLSVNAGVDMFMEPDHWLDAIGNLKKAVEKGDVKQERIDDAVLRILKVKLEMGLFENPVGDQKLAAALGEDESRQIARKAVKESLVLLKNENKVLPIRKNAKVLVTGPASNNVGIQCGGWTISWRGGMDSQGKKWTEGSTILEGFKRIAQDNGGVVVTDPKGAKDADVAVVVIGEKPYAEYEGDDGDLGLYSGKVLDKNREALEEAKALGIPTVVVLVSGRPRIVTEEIGDWDAFVAAWLPGSEGDAVAEVLYGIEDFSGKLPITWPRDLNQIPVNYDSGSDKSPLFPYGFGLKMYN